MTMPMRRLLACSLVAVFVSAQPAFAQADAGERHGFAGAFGVGISSAGISCAPQCTVDRQSGPSYMLRVGGHATEQFVIGLEATVFRADVKTMSPPGKWSLSFLSLVGLWYPTSDDDFFIKVGAGVATTKVDVSFKNVTSIQLTATDVGGKVGIGKDFRFADRLALTAFAEAMFTPRSQALSGGSNSGAKMSADLIHVGLAVAIP